jgi:hypothetical protein
VKCRYAWAQAMLDEVGIAELKPFSKGQCD